ncbi:phosphatidylinositol mannoside acyltransferase [Epidermidibacterium keratini]
MIPRLPRPVASGLFDRAAAIAAARPGSFDQLRRNLRVVVGDEMPEPELDDLVRRGVSSYLRYWREAFQLPSMDPQDVLRRTESPMWDAYVQPHLDSGRGVIVALTHSGNWDAAAVYVVKGLGVPMATVAERLKPESLFRRFKRYRESLGMEVAALSGDDQPATALMQRYLREGNMVTLLGDRDLAGRGIPVTLCGRETTIPGGPALLAIQTGAALLPLGLSFTEIGWRLDWFPEVKIPTEGRLRERISIAQQQVADCYTEAFRAHPEDWHMLQPIWPGV